MTRFHSSQFAAMTGLAAIFCMAAATEGHAQDTAQSEHYQLRVDTIAEPLEHPWGLALLPDGRFLVTERDPGNLRLGNENGELSDPLDGIPEVHAFEGPTPRTQGGLFDVKLHPQFEENGIIFVSLAMPTERGAAVKILRARLEGEGVDARLQDVEELWVMQEDDQDPSGLHFGGRMVIDPDDGSIYLSIGERRSLERAQDPEDQAGSVLRMTAEGEPHPDQPTFEAGEANEFLFTMGNRNIQALASHPETGELWGVDHGPEGGDRIDRLEAGHNYGWPFIAGGPDYSGAPIGVGLEHEGMASPIHVFDETVAPSGLVIYDGEMYPEWSGDLLIGGMQAEGLVRVRIEGDEVVDEEWIELDRRIRDVQIAGDGSLWLITEHEDGEVLRVSAAEEVTSTVPAEEEVEADTPTEEAE